MASYFCVISKSNIKLLFSSHLFLLLLQVSNCQPIRSKNNVICATFYTDPSAQGEFFLVNNHYQSTNLVEDQRAWGSRTTVWNGIGSIISVERGCEITVCDDIEFEGNCNTLTPGSHSATADGKSFLSNIISMKCTCTRGLDERHYRERLALDRTLKMEAKYREKWESETQRQRLRDTVRGEQEKRRQLEERPRQEQAKNYMMTADDRRESGGGSGGGGSRGGGCLKRGTRILMEDMSEKTVESLRVGNVILDKDLQPTIVLGVAREFLLNQTFYGFDQNDSFFTGNHLFVGPSNSKENEILKLYAKLPSQLYKNNPLMAYVNVTEIGNDENVDLYKIQREPSNQLAVTSTRIDKVYQDAQNYPEETLMYDIMVDSPSGTYIANGYVCRHELPPLEHWPNTMSLLFRLMATPIFKEKLPSFSFSVEKVRKLHEIADDIAGVVKDFMSELSLKELLKLEEQHGGARSSPLMMLADVNAEECISKIFNNPMISAAGLRLYSRVGPVIAPILDNGSGESENQVAKLQHELLNIINFEIENRLALIM